VKICGSVANRDAAVNEFAQKSVAGLIERGMSGGQINAFYNALQSAVRVAVHQDQEARAKAKAERNKDLAFEVAASDRPSKRQKHSSEESANDVGSDIDMEG